MKRILIVIACCLAVYRLQAQQTRQAPGYPDTAEIVVSEQTGTVSVRSGKEVAVYPVRKSGTMLILKNASDNRRILDQLDLDTAAISSFGDMPQGLQPAEKLIAKAYGQPDKRLLILAGAPEEDSFGLIEGEHELAGGIDRARLEEEDGNKGLAIGWGYLAVAGLVLIAVTAAVTRYLSRPPEDRLQDTETTEEQPSASSPRHTDTKKLRQQLADLQQQHRQLQAERKEVEKQLAALQTFDKNYFNEAFRRLVAPMGAAIDSGTQKEIVENMMKMAAHFASLTRYKIAKKQSYDEANIRYMLQQNQGGDAQAPEITAATPLDKTPGNIQALIGILKQYRSQGLDDTIVSGYKIKNL